MSDEEPNSQDRISEGSIRLVVPKRKAPESIRNIAALADDETRVEALLARLDQTPDPSARSRILVEIGITMRDGLDDPEQALEALLEAWRNDPCNEDVLDHLEPLVRAQDKWIALMELTRSQLLERGV